MTVGFLDTDQYDNATLDNWILTLGGMLYARIIGGYVEYDSSVSETNVTNILGGLGPNATRDSSGIITCQFAPPFKDEPVIFPCSASVNDQIFIHESAEDEFAITSLQWNGVDAFELADKPSYIYGAGR